jgi:PD-(D/E)XK nuclease superfamily
MVPAPPQRLAFLRQVAALWLGAQPKAQQTRLQYLRSLARLAGDLKAVEGPTDPELDAFRRLVMERPDDLRRRLLGANVQRLRGLPRQQRLALRALEVWPDLLSPLEELRYEPSHSRLLGYFLDPRRCPYLAGPLLRAFLELAECPGETLEPDNLRNALVTVEAVVPSGRIDIRIETPLLLVFVEVKIDAGEGIDQLPRYRVALDRQAQSRAAVLVFLTLPEADEPARSVVCKHLTFEEVLTSWLAFAGVDSELSGFLARYLKSVALVLSRAGHGTFEQWSFADQRRALDLVAAIDPGEPHEHRL